MSTTARRASQHAAPAADSASSGLLTAEEAAAAMAVTVDAVYRAIREGRLKAWARSGVYLIPACELDAWQPVRGRGKRRAAVPALAAAAASAEPAAEPALPPSRTMPAS